MNKYKFPIILIMVFLAFIALTTLIIFRRQSTIIPKQENQPPNNDNPLTIQAMREENYPGSELVIEKTLTPGRNYKQFIASYLSDGLKIYGLLTIPQGNPPVGGWPVIIFNHGYLPPDTYQITARYVAYVDAIAKSGYIVFKSDYRGHGNSEGQPEGAYYSPAYATDVLNALSSVKKLKEANPNKIGMWGHSMGGNIILRDIVVNTQDLKAAVIWGGVVGTYDDLMNNWQRKVKYQPPQRELTLRNSYRKNLTDSYGTPTTNPEFWNSVDPTAFLSEIMTPVQLHTGGNDEEVPVAFSASLKDKLLNLNKTVEYYNYPGGDHNISSPNFESAMKRTIDFFDKYLKTEGLP
jgi:dipeptidyl aminopeptidase/acylaminoacyl peptidase